MLAFSKIIPLSLGLVSGLMGLISSGQDVMAESTAEAGVSVATPWARATPGGVTVGVAYLEVRTGSKDGDRLIGVSSPRAARTELHTHAIEDGVMKMRKVDSLAIKAGRALALRPGGHHIMLFDLKGPLKAGEILPLTLTFEKAGAVSVSAPVAPIGAPGPGGKPARGSGAGGHDERGSATED